jgi:hypothetical protein
VLALLLSSFLYGWLIVACFRRSSCYLRYNLWWYQQFILQYTPAPCCKAEVGGKVELQLFKLVWLGAHDRARIVMPRWSGPATGIKLWAARNALTYLGRRRDDSTTYAFERLETWTLKELVYSLQICYKNTTARTALLALSTTDASQQYSMLGSNLHSTTLNTTVESKEGTSEVQWLAGVQAQGNFAVA